MQNNQTCCQAKKSALICLALYLFSLPVTAGIFVTKAVTGGWSSTSTWVSGSVPGATDSVVIASGASISTGTNQSCGAINILGTLTLTGGNYLTVEGDGATTFGSVAGNGTLGYASIGNRNISLTGNWTFNGTSSNTGENVTFDGTGNQVLQGVITTGTGGSGLITINNSGGQVIMKSSMAFSNQGLTITSGTFNPNGFAITINKLTLSGGTLVVDASTWAGDYAVTTIGAPSAGSSILYTNANPTIYSAITYQNLSFSGSGTSGADGNLTIQGNLTSTGGGTFSFGADNVTLSGTVTANNIAGLTTTGTVSFTKTAGTSTLTGILDAGPLTMNGNGGTLLLGSGLTHNISNLTMTKGTLNGGSSTLNISGTWTGTGATYTAAGGTIGWSSSGTQSIPVGPTYFNLTISGPGTKTIASTPLTVSGSLSLMSGSSLTTAVTTAINVGSNWTNNGGTFASTGTTVVFDGTAAQVIGGSQGTSFNNITISTVGANTVLSAAATVGNQLKFTSGNMDATNYPLTLSAGAPAITGASASSYIITGNGVATTGNLTINNLAANTVTSFPIGTSNYYLPVTVNPGASTGNSFSAFVFQGLTTNGASNGTAYGSTALSKLLNLVWDIGRTAGSGTATIAVNWASSGTALEGSYFQNYGLNIGMAHYTGGMWQNEIGSGSVAAGTATAAFSSFSPFSVGGLNEPLPILLTQFSAVADNNLVKLAWETATEGNCQYFAIERSNVGGSWQNIGQVPAQLYSPQQADYFFNDQNPPEGLDCYRLKIVGLDNSIMYSEVRTVQESSAESIQVYPNPASDFITIHLPHPVANTNIRLLNINGQVLQSSKAIAGLPSTIQMPVSGYLPGCYLIEITSPGSQRKISTILISK